MSEISFDTQIVITYDDGVPLRLMHVCPFLWALQLKSSNSEWVYPPGWPDHYELKPAPMAPIRQYCRDMRIDSYALKRMLHVFGFNASGKYVPIINRLLPNTELLYSDTTKLLVSNCPGGGAWGASRRLEYWIQLIAEDSWRCMSRAYFPCYVSGRTGEETTSLVAEEVNSVDEAMTACKTHFAAEYDDEYKFWGERRYFEESFNNVNKRVHRLKYFDESYRSRQVKKAMERLAALKVAEAAGISLPW